MIPEWLIYALSFGFVGIFVYVILRFGPVSHSYLRFEKPEIARLRDMETAYTRTHPRQRPVGRALYKRRLASHAGLAVYPNGVYAKFCRGPKGRYRFVPSEALTDIFPVTYEMPLRTTRATRLGLAGWKALQFETAHGWVFVADSRRHRFDDLIPALKTALGARWDVIYHPDQNLWSNILTGDAMVHRVIREMRGRSPVRPGGPIAAVPYLPTAAATDRGSLLYEESRQDLQSRIAAYRRAVYLLIASGGGLVAIGALLATFLTGVVAWILPMLGMLLVALAVLLVVGIRNAKPIRVYEHGLEFPGLGGATSQFVAFGDVLDVRESHNFLDGDFYRFTRFGAPPLAVHRSPGFAALLPEIRSRVGRAEHRVRVEPAPADRRRFRRWETSFYAFALVAGLVISFAFVVRDVGHTAGGVLLWEFLLLFPPVTIVLMTAVPFLLHRSWKMERDGLRVWIPAAVVAVLLAVMIVALAIGASAPTYTMPSPAMQPRPTTTALAPGSYENRVLDVRGPIRVDAGEILTLRNVTVRMNLSADRAFGIWVGAGGTLITDRATIENVTPPFAYPFEIRGSARIRNSTISGIWGNLSQVNGDGGLEIYSDDVTLANTTITGARTNGILVINAAPEIVNVTIRDAGDDGVELRHSAALLQNDTISGCSWASVVEDGSSARILGSLIEGNDHGIAIESSTPVLAFNVFQMNRNYAVWYDGYSQPTLQRNTFIGNDQDVVAESASSLFEVCGFVSIGLGIVSLLILAAVYRAELRRTRDAGGSRTP